MSDTFKNIAAEIGALVTEKNAAYGNSFAKCGGFLRLLYPNGIQPDQYEDCLCMCRIFDKQMRIATHKTALGESPYRDIAGYGILGIAKDQKEAARGAFLNGAVHGPMLPDGVTEAGAIATGRVSAETAKDTAPHGADLLPIFTLIAKEHARSLDEHEPWEEAGHSPATMLAVIKAELAEVELALSMGDHAETVKELVHTANTTVKAIAELTRRGHL